MWQLGFPSPHVHYFDSASLIAIIGRHGFKEIDRHRLASLSASGLYARVRYSRDVPVWKAVAITVAVTVMIPLLRLLPSDSTVWLSHSTSTRLTRAGRCRG